MKKLILILSLVIFIPGFQANSQEWAPDGAEWYYDYENFWYTGYVHITVLGDTVIHDTTCRVLSREAVIHNLEFGTTNTYYYGRSYMYSDEDKVYLFENNKFYAIYNFLAVPGDTIILPQNSNLQAGCDPEGIVNVIDTGAVIINGIELRTISVAPVEDTHWAIFGNIIETIGPINHYMLPELHWCVADLFEGGPLRCYSDPDFGLYSTGISPECDYLVSVPEFAEKDIKIFPNPCNGALHIEIPDGDEGSLLKLYNSSGQLVLSRKLGQSENIIDLSGLRAGLYCVRIESKDYSFVSRVIMN